MPTHGIARTAGQDRGACLGGTRSHRARRASRPAAVAHAHNCSGRASDDRRRLDMVIYGVTLWGGALSCDATLVSPVSRDGPGVQRIQTGLHWPPLRAATYPELLRNGPQRLVVLGSEGGRPLEHGSPGSRARPRSPPQAARPARSPPCSGYRLGSALVAAAFGRRAARHRPIGGRSGVAGGVARSGRRTSLRRGSCWTSLTLRGPACCRSERERSLSAASGRLKTVPSGRRSKVRGGKKMSTLFDKATGALRS